MDEIRELNIAAKEIEQIARGMGLDFYPVHFEICPAEALYTFGAYGMPVRFTHWSFGKAFYRLKMQYDLNVSRIYELVINSNPAYAFLLAGNDFLQNKLVIGHVYAHVDFFKNNRYFKKTPKDMVDRMAAHAQQIREYELDYGPEKVEQILDAALSIQEHVDARAHIAPVRRQDKAKKVPLKQKRTPYDDLWDLDGSDAAAPELTEEVLSEDLLLFLIKQAPGLEEWQRDVLSIVREESLYFNPQIETKIINEGWATYWHTRIMRELELNGSEVLDFAMMHSQVVQPGRGSLNPYYLGNKILEDLGERFGQEFLFEVRETENDASLVRNYLTRDLVEKLNLFNFRKIGSQWQVTDVNWEKVRDNLVQQLVHGGNPYIIVVSDDYEGKGGLLLRHRHEGLDLDIIYLEKSLAYVQRLWGKTAVLETLIDGKKVLFECLNGSVTRRQTGK